MAKFFNITNHSLTSEQIADIKNKFNIDEVVDLNPGEVDPQASSAQVNNLATNLIANGNFSLGDVAMVQTEQTLVFCLVSALQQIGVRCVVATTRRESAEKVLPDGSIIKTNVFRHVRFRDLPQII
jgi:hypothetical protein